MFPRTKNRKAISTVLTTMIILVASVVLGTGVVLYGTSLFQTNANAEGIAVQGVKVWVNKVDTNGTAWGAASIRNSGDKLESVDTISIRGTAVPFASWYVATPANSASHIQDQFISAALTNGHLFNYTGNPASIDVCLTSSPGPLFVDVDGTGPKTKLCMFQASGPISLNPGDAAVVYFKLPLGVLTPVDAGATTSVAIYAGKTGAPQTVTIANP